MALVRLMRLLNSTGHASGIASDFKRTLAGHLKKSGITSDYITLCPSCGSKYTILTAGKDRQTVPFGITSDISFPASPLTHELAIQRTRVP